MVQKSARCWKPVAPAPVPVPPALVELARRFPSAKLAFTGIAEPVSEGEEVAKKIGDLGVDLGEVLHGRILP